MVIRNEFSNEALPTLQRSVYKDIGNSNVAIEGVVSNVANSAYGENVSTQLIANIASNPHYKFTPANFREFTSVSGSVTTENGVFECSTGTGQLGYGAFQSFRSIDYRAGAGALIRFGAIFPASEDGLECGCGGLQIGNELSFGIKDSDFGIWHRYGGFAEVRTLTITTSASGSENATVFLDDVEYTIPLTSGTVQENAYEIATYLQANATGFNADSVDDKVKVSSSSDGPKNGTFSFSSSSAVASFTRTTAGVLKSSNFVKQSDFNGIKISTFDQTKGNTYQIQYQNGYGDIKFFIENSKGNFVLVHTIDWNNSNTDVNLSNPSLRLGIYGFNADKSTNSTVKCAFISGYSYGTGSKIRNPRSFANTKTINSTLTNLLTIRNKRIINGQYNQIGIDPVYLTLANDGTKSAVFELRANPDVSGTKNYQEVTSSGNLVSLSETNGDTVDSETGRPLGAFTVAKGQSLIIDLSVLEIRVPPTLDFVVAAKMTSGSAELTASLTWYEDV